MKIVAQTIFMPPVTLYDTEQRSPDTGSTKAIKQFLKPVVQVTTSKGETLYKTGEFYSPTGFYILMTILGLTAGYLLYKAVK